MHIVIFRAVHSTRFSVDGLRVISASDDCSVRLWDLSGEDEVFQVKEHKVITRTLKMIFTLHCYRDIWVIGLISIIQSYNTATQ